MLGTIGVIETEAPVNMASFQCKCVERGIWVRPFGHNVYVMPPYIISDEELRKLCTTMVDIVREEISGL